MYLNAAIGVHPGNAAEKSIDLFTDGFDESKHDPIHDGGVC